MGDTPQVFLSYASEDADEVEKIYQRLLDNGFRPWMDKHDLLPGQQWSAIIRSAIRESDFVLVCLSENSVDKRGYLQREIKFALDVWQEKLESDIYLIPVRLTECEVPESIREFHWVDLFREDGWTRLLKSLSRNVRDKGTEQETRAASKRRSGSYIVSGVAVLIVAVMGTLLFMADGTYTVMNWLMTPTLTPTLTPTATTTRLARQTLAPSISGTRVTGTLTPSNTFTASPTNTPQQYQAESKYSQTGVYADPVGNRFAAISTLSQQAQLYICARAGQRYLVALTPCHEGNAIGWVVVSNLSPPIPPLPANLITPVPDSTPTPEVLGVVNLAANQGLVVRRFPRLEAESLGRVVGGDTLKVLGRDAPGAWFQVQTSDGQRGWVSSLYVTLNVDHSAIPVVSSP